MGTSLVLLLLIAGPAVAQPPSFTKDVAPIVWRRCAVCHRPGEIAPFSLLTYDDVKRRATLVAAATKQRVMPPWKPVGDGADFVDSRRLTDEEFRTIQAWVTAGAPEGDRADLPPMPAWGEGWKLGPPDLIVSMPVEYVVPADGPDVFRSFVIPIPLKGARYVRAIEFRSDNPRVVHHATLGMDRTRTSRQLDARDEEPGYAGSMAKDARYPEGQLLGWTPGQAPHASPDDMAWRLESGSDLVVQLHLQPTGKREPVTVRVGFFFTDAPPARTPVGLRLGSQTIDMAPGQRAYVIEDRYIVPVDVELFAIQPHAHNLARRMTASATLPDGSTRPLITIEDWDFRWQDVYRYARPLVLPKGTTIAMRYMYDNSSANPRNPNHPPARVVWGQNTTDEMGDLWLQVAARTPADHDLLAADVRRKASTEDLAAYRKLLQQDPANPIRHDAVAALYLESGDFQAAIEQYTASLRIDPASPQTHYNLGIALSLRNRRDEAMAHFEEALRLDPGYAQAHTNLGALLQSAGRGAEAAEHYRRALALRPDNVEARTNFGHWLSSTGRLADAVREFRAALDLRADAAQALSGLAWIRATAADAGLRDPAEAVSLAERAVAATRRRDVGALDALAAAYASAGRFTDAVATAETGAMLAASLALHDVARQFRERLELYRQGRPFIAR